MFVELKLDFLRTVKVIRKSLPENSPLLATASIAPAVGQDLSAPVIQGPRKNSGTFAERCLAIYTAIGGHIREGFMEAVSKKSTKMAC